jgi:hypothetical protein
LVASSLLCLIYLLFYQIRINREYYDVCSEGSIVINPMGKRFYLVPCEEQASIFTNATLSIDDEGRYIIEGSQTLYNEHNGVSSSYEKLLCEHPAELIIKRTFLGLRGTRLMAS